MSAPRSLIIEMNEDRGSDVAFIIYYVVVAQSIGDDMVKKWKVCITVW